MKTPVKTKRIDGRLPAVVKYNLACKHGLENKFEMPLPAIWAKYGMKPFVWVFECTGCARDRLPAPIVKFYQFKVSRLLCYSCQKEQKENI